MVLRKIKSKLLCDCFKFLLKRSHFQQHQIGRKENFEGHIKHFSTVWGNKTDDKILPAPIFSEL